VNVATVVLSPEQQTAVRTPGNVLVRAGAGSGKTEVLARRFVSLIAGDIDGCSPLMPSQLAAITFTEKAAHDMRRRIADVLNERLQTEPREHLRVHLFAARKALAAARISTIHAFCARMLRENAVEAELDPEFEILDEFESQTFLQHVCREFLVDAVRQSDPGAGHLVRAYGLDSGLRRQGAVEIVMRILDEVAQLGRTPHWLYEATAATAARIKQDEREIALLISQLVDLFDQLLAFEPVSTEAKLKIALLRKRCDEFRQAIIALDVRAETQNFALLREFCDSLPAARGDLADCVKSIKAVIRRSSNRFGLEGELISRYGAYCSVRRALEVAATIRALGARIDQAKTEERLVTFNDLLFLTRQLLERNSSVRVRCKAELRELLIDEFQDTDQIQQQIVARLVEPEPGVASPHLFAVGDEKQSIYRFRGADVAGFGRIKQTAGLKLCELPLRGNRRSSPNIVSFVNAVGAKLMRALQSPAPAYQIQWGPDHELAALRDPLSDPPVEIVMAVGESAVEPERSPNEASAASRRSLEARALATRILELVSTETVVDQTSGKLRPLRYSDVVILLRAFTDVAIYEATLLDTGIPSYTVKGRGFFGRQEVLDLIELLSAIDDPSDSLALVAALRSPLFGLSDDCLAEIGLRPRRTTNGGKDHAAAARFAAIFFAGGPSFPWLSSGREDAIRAWRILDELRRLRERGAISAVIEHALAATAYEAVLLGLRQGTQRVANVRKLVDLAREFEVRRFFTFHDLVIYLRRLAEQEPYEPTAQVLGESENVVRLMTVHQAKGLEFPVVILADCGRRFDNDTRDPVVDPANGLLIRETTGSGMDEIPNALLEKFRVRNRSEQEAELLRVLYVGLTRARDRLIISEGAMVEGWAKELRKLIGEEVCSEFIKSGAAQKMVDCQGLRVQLMRPRLDRHLSATQPSNPAADNQFTVEALAARRLTFEPTCATELVISPTALSDFERCPRQFHLRHNLKLPEIRTNGTKSSSLTMGIVAHAVLERLQFAADNENDIRQLTENIGLAAGLDSRERSLIAADLARCVGKLAAPAAREVPFFHHVGNGLFVRGQIDALIEQADRIIVRDYKYASASDGAMQRLAMEAYALALAAAYPGKTIAAEIVFLKDGGETLPLTLDPLPEIEQRILSLGRELISSQAAADFPKKPPSSRVCYSLGCRFVDRCWGQRDASRWTPAVHGE
jgi:ATP-dependent helicase/nuclease subunit A